MPEIIIDPTQFSHDEKLQLMSEMIGSCRKEGPWSCLIWQNCVNSNGYPQKRITLPIGQRKLVMVTRLVYALATGSVIGANKTMGMQVSHLCHTSRCICHLSLEPSQVNNFRRICVNRGFCEDTHSWNGITYPKCLLGVTDVVFSLVISCWCLVMVAVSVYTPPPPSLPQHHHPGIAYINSSVLCLIIF